MPVRAIITEGTTADSTKSNRSIAMINGIAAEHLLADRGYDVDTILSYLEEHDILAVIPPKSNRIKQREYDQEIYKARHLIENAFLYLKQWRGIATRYAKNAASFLAAVHIRCIFLWASIS
jgi:transposase